MKCHEKIKKKLISSVEHAPIAPMNGTWVDQGQVHTLRSNLGVKLDMTLTRELDEGQSTHFQGNNGTRVLYYSH